MSATTGYKWARAAGWKAGGEHTGIRYSAAVREAFWAAMRSGPRPRRQPESPACRRCRRSSGSNGLATCPELLLLPSWRSTDHGGRVRRCRSPNAVGSRNCSGRRYPGAGAELLDRHRDTIGREIVKGLTGSGYRARVGQDVADTNKAPQRTQAAITACPVNRVVQRLEQRHSRPRSPLGCGRTSRRTGDVGVTRDDLSGPLRSAAWGVGRLVKTALRTGRTRKPQGRNTIDRHRFGTR